MHVPNVSKNLLFFGLAGILVFGSIAGVAYSQNDAIPAWVKNLFTFWTDDQVSDADLLSAIEFLIDAGIIQTNQSSRIADLEQTVDDLQQENTALKGENAALKEKHNARE